jgi:hypothetical protein
MDEKILIYWMVLIVVIAVATTYMLTKVNTVNSFNDAANIFCIDRGYDGIQSMSSEGETITIICSTNEEVNVWLT